MNWPVPITSTNSASLMFIFAILTYIPHTRFMSDASDLWNKLEESAEKSAQNRTPAGN